MKVRMLAVIAIFSLAAWLPVPAQQPVTPVAPAQQTPAPAGDSRKATTKHECSKGSENVNGCHGKDTRRVKADCCQGKSAKGMPSSTKSDKGDQATVPCCMDMKEGPSTGKEGKPCCGSAAKGCCLKMAAQCPAQANGK